MKTSKFRIINGSLKDSSLFAVLQVFVRRVRRRVVQNMRAIMRRQFHTASTSPAQVVEELFGIVDEMLRDTKCLCNLLDVALVDETMTFLEENRITSRPDRDEFSESVAEFMQRNRLKIDLVPPGGNFAGLRGGASIWSGSKKLERVAVASTLQTPCSEFVAKV